MPASTTQEAFIPENDSIQKELSSNKLVNRALSTLDKDEFSNLIKEQYGALWGTLKFEDSLGDYINEARPFLYIDDNVDLQVLRQFMINEWKLQTPNIVIPILSAITRHKPFKNLKMVETLKNGIKNVYEQIDTFFHKQKFDKRFLVDGKVANFKYTKVDSSSRLRSNECNSSMN
ncbi:unnamed protein product [Rotaria magnacalcarata]|uniref:Uncharacterized protein n=1 Tax=Rotaria magnacalcarata TaxID=392030 RepID=A0A819P5Z1_9BILA|nr:unnamed protein product [Rotaria magnacalcarata]CAF4058079.1 unnamed protein product [Rotaria magnacalcarata]